MGIIQHRVIGLGLIIYAERRYLFLDNDEIFYRVMGIIQHRVITLLIFNAGSIKR